MLPNAKRVYALKEWTVEYRRSNLRSSRNGWYYWRTYGAKDQAKGPYASLSSVTLMIARELKREIGKRDAPYSVEETPC
jgi:hypothetical protein